MFLIKDRQLIILLLACFISITPLLEVVHKLLLTVIVTIYLGMIIQNIRQSTYIFILTIFLFLFLVDVITFFVYQNSSFSLYSFMILIYLIFVFLVIRDLRGKTIFAKFEKLIFIVSLFSFSIFLSLLLFPSLSTMSMSYTYGGFTANTFFFLNFYLNEDGSLVKRYVGMASEPALWQFVLNFSLIVYLRTINRVNYIKLIFYIVFIVSTFSTLGILILFFILGNYFLRRKTLLFLFMLILSSILMLNNYSFFSQSNVVMKMSESYLTTRYMPTISAFDKAIENPLGHGSSNYQEKWDLEGVGGHDSYSQVFYRYGVVVFFALVILLVLVLKSNFNGFVLLSLTLATQTIWFLPFFLIVTFYFIKVKSDAY